MFSQNLKSKNLWVDECPPPGPVASMLPVAYWIMEALMGERNQ